MAAATFSLLFFSLSFRLSPPLALSQATDIDIHAKEILRIREELNEIMAKHSGQKIDKVERDTERDNFMSAEEAKEYGIVDDILTKPEDSDDDE